MMESKMNNSKKFFGLITMVSVCALLGGCNIFGWMAAPWGSDVDIKEVPAQYTQLKDKSVAVLVAADIGILAQHKDAPYRVTSIVSQRLAMGIESLDLMKPNLVRHFQNKNQNWYTTKYENLLKAVGTDAIIIIELTEYRTHEPGNKYQWQGVIAGTVTLIDSQASDPSEAVFQQVVRNTFPENTKVGVLDADEVRIQQGMNSLFARDAAGLFFDHEVKTMKK